MYYDKDEYFSSIENFKDEFFSFVGKNLALIEYWSSHFNGEGYSARNFTLGDYSENLPGYNVSKSEVISNLSRGLITGIFGDFE
ncbi:hypothetical protein [Paenibacillus piri]|uniref:Uncharacterized protein n=1 Tax=Paenibacillus piri TaxID=2547395 RepID=A0A4R5KTP6_9BACL|nr:hypothetical protein [Paenibacillus piri]TDF98277.1 hypothetical protein E1757_12345 [Paenibacillus piri]